MPETVLFACTQNAGRSQMAAALFNQLADPSRARAISAGTSPASRVHANVVTVMRERGVDLSGAVPQRLTADLAASADLLVTMGCGEDCPVVPGLAREDWPIPDPAGRSLDEVRDIRDGLLTRVTDLIARYNRQTRTTGT